MPELDEAAERNRRTSYLLGTFTVPYMRLLYSTFEGDLLLPFVLGEIGMHNVGLRYESGGDAPLEAFDPRRRVRPCNALSISTVTGIPRETVRRKVEILVKMGLIERDEAGHLRVTPAAFEHTLPSSLKGIDMLLAAAERIRAAQAKEQPSTTP
jgi:predicted transcriptional regulator